MEEIEVEGDPNPSREIAKAIKVVIWVDSPPTETSEQEAENWRIELCDALYEASFAAEINRRVDDLINDSSVLTKLNCKASVFSDD
jgi:hypothetical protein